MREVSLASTSGSSERCNDRGCAHPTCNCKHTLATCFSAASVYTDTKGPLASMPKGHNGIDAERAKNGIDAEGAQ